MRKVCSDFFFIKLSFQIVLVTQMFLMPNLGSLVKNMGIAEGAIKLVGFLKNII